MSKVAVIGAGAMGLAAAFHALKAGHEVTVYEGDRVPGGMAAHFDFDGISLERFYHFVCKSDRPLFDLMEELGIGDRMVWRETSMGYFIDGTHYAWGDPVSLLRFPKLTFPEKLRYGLQMFLQSKRRSFDDLENISTKDWIVRWNGARVYDILWRPLFDLKFYQYADNISAAWISTRIKRIGTSRKSLLQEELGVIDGGSETLIGALVDAIGARGGTIHLGRPVREIVVADGRVTGIRTDDGTEPFERVISTVPTPYVPAMVPALPAETRSAYEAIVNIGVVCVVVKLGKRVTPHFWVNINDADIAIPGLVEFSNLRSLSSTVVYLPFYMPPDNPKFSRPDAEFVAESVAAIRKLNPLIGEADILATRVGRLRHAQPVCEPGFAAKIPPIQTPIGGLQIADTCFYYPEDRGISESVHLARQMAANL